MKDFFYLLPVLVFLLSCNGQKKMTAKENSLDDGRLALVATDSYSGVDSTETMVITNAKALKSFYARVNRTRKPGLPVPDIDFSEHMVVVLCSADESYDDSQKLSILKETDDEMVLGMSETVQVSGNVTNKPKVSPFFVYKMPLTEKKVSFERMK